MCYLRNMRNCVVICVILVLSFVFHQTVWRNELRVWKLDSSATCSIPEIDPFSKSALLMIELHGKYDGVPLCIGQEVKFSIDYKRSSLVRKQTESMYWKDHICCYTVFRNKNLKTTSGMVNSVECYPITDEVTEIPLAHQNLDIKCRDISTNETVYRDQLTIFRLNQTLEDQVEELRKRLNKMGGDQLSVLLLGFDSVSRMGIVRHMPKTHGFLLRNLSGIEYLGFNKIGRGTIENMIAMTTGCVPKYKNLTRYVNPDCDLVWTHFEKQGYRTVHYEDVGFNEKKLYPVILNGSAGTAAQYSITGLMDGIRYINENEMGTTYDTGYGCNGNQYMYDIFVDEILEIARTFRNKPYFHFIWNTDPSHVVMRNTQFLDEPSFKLLTELRDQFLLNNTILFVMSDHGPWNGIYLNTEAGNVERLMPAFYVVFPRWFKTKYSVAAENFQLNARRLTTQFDFHETLLDLLDLTQISNSALESRRPSEGKLGQSLFLRVPLDRTCESANIPHQFCVCLKRTNVHNADTNPYVRTAAQFTIDQLQVDLQSFPLCAPLELESILQARRLESRVTEEQSAEIFQVVFTTLPAHAEFQTTVNLTEGIKLIGKPVRNNVYGNQSSCIADWENATYAKTICYCH